MLITFVSGLKKNKITNLLIIILFILLPNLISKRYLASGETPNFSPFSMDNPFRIMDGNYNVTLLTSIILIVVSLLITYFVSIKYWKTKDL